MPKFNITPVPKPRMTRSDKWNERPVVLRYRAFSDDIREQAEKAGFILGTSVMIVFAIPMPDSWSRKRKLAMVGKPHKQTPDIDNLCKAVMDALLPAGDSDVWCLVASKHWAEAGAIEIKNLDKSEVDYILVRKDIKKGVIE